MAEGNLQFINEELKKFKNSQPNLPETFVIRKASGEIVFEVQKRLVVGVSLIVVLLVLFIVLLATTLSGNGGSPTIYQQNGYKMDPQAPDYGIRGQQVDLQMKTLIRDGIQTGTGYTVKFGQIIDNKLRDVCAYPPTIIYTSQGSVQADEDITVWNPQQQSELFLPGNTTVLVPFSANPSAVLDISRAPDFNSLLQFNGKLYMGIHHESPRPSGVSFLEIDQSQGGEFSVVATRAVDFSEYNGTWTSCAGSITPWGTHLGSQEYEPDARLMVECNTLQEMTNLKDFDSQNIQDFMRYYGYYNADVRCYDDQKELTMDNVKQMFNPYMYGHIPEISVDEQGSPSVKMWFTLGRVSHEAGVILADNKTVYLTDDGTNVGFYKFISDQPGNLSSGCIYGAKATQNIDQSFNLTWIQLGCSTNVELERTVRNGITFNDIFATAQPNVSGDGPICEPEFTSTNVGHDHRLECLKLNPNQQTNAAFLETRRLLAYFGGTTEFSKWEGITYDAKRNKLYHGMSEVRYGMEDNMKKNEANTKYDIGGPNDVRLTYNPCGCVYASDLDTNYTAYNLYPLVCGQLAQDDSENECVVDKLAGPDNVAMAGPDSILISEDTDGHVNNFLWMYDLNTTVLTRIASCMYGSEVSGPQYFENVEGYSYIFYSCQHPYDESNRDKVMDAEATGQAGWVNYIGPLPVLRTSDSITCANIEAPNGIAQHQTQATNTCYIGTYREL